LISSDTPRAKGLIGFCATHYRICENDPVIEAAAGRPSGRRPFIRIFPDFFKNFWKRKNIFKKYLKKIPGFF
jgi:hypothetical protein